LVAGLALVLVAVIATIVLRDAEWFDWLVSYEGRVRQFHARHAVLVYAVALLAYVLVTGLSIPAATAMSLIYGWYFGFWRGVLVVSFGSTAGATIAFLFSRYLFREYLHLRFRERLERWNERLAREGAYYLFTLRLVPVPFFLVNSLMGLTPIRVRTFWWVSQLGMLPGTMVYVYAGSVAPGLRELAEGGVRGLPIGQIMLALALIGLLPWGARAIARRLRARVGRDSPPVVESAVGPRTGGRGVS
jgi:uncharacterized membrane protein YdjX (TVP38/TMEM64 family)